MAYNQELALQSNPKPYQFDPNRMSDLLDTMRRNADLSNASQANTEGVGLENIARGYTNAEKARQDEIAAAVQQQVMRGVQAGNVPPPLSQGPPPAQNLSGLNIPPVMQSAANASPAATPPFLAGQQPSIAPPAYLTQQQDPQASLVVKDRYTPVEQGINQDQALLDQKKQHLAVASYDPSNPVAFITNKDKNSQTIADEQKGIDGRKFQLSVNRKWDAILPNLQQRIQGEMDDNGGINQAAYNVMTGMVRDAISKDPTLTKADGYKDFTALLEKSKPNPQPNMISMMNQPAPVGGGKSLAEQVQAGTLTHKDAVASILNNRAMGAAAKQKELIEYSAAMPGIGSGYTGPQMAVFAKNAADPTFNRTVAAIDAVTPNIDALVKLSDQYGRLNVPMLNAAIQKGDFAFGGQTITNMEQLQKIIAEEAGKVFGGSATSDFKIRLGDKMLDLSLGQDNFRSNALQLKEAMNNKKRSMSDLTGPLNPWAGGQAQKPPQAAPGNAQAMGAKYAPDVVAKAQRYAALPANDPRRTPDHDAKVKEILGQ